MSVRAAFRRQARACHDLGSPFTCRLLDTLADRLRPDHRVGEVILNWPGDPIADALALRVAGALHALVLTGRSPALVDAYPPETASDDEQLWQAVVRSFDEHGSTLLRFVQSPPQTNEVARSAILASGFFMIARLTSLPLDLLEIGASAGLNLYWDRFAYDLGGLSIRNGEARPLLVPSWQGPPPPSVDVQIGERAGCDRAPIDIQADDELLRLRAYVWADQTDRQTRLDEALAVARSSPIPIDRADAAEWAASRLDERRDGCTTVLFHSIVWQYMSPDSQRRLLRTIDDVGRRARTGSPFAWLRMEPETTEAAGLKLTLWPDGKTLLLAEVDYHGRWVRWHGEHIRDDIVQGKA